jgi:solute carrier family 35 (UDP-sugar transporter), member A1/2/3
MVRQSTSSSSSERSLHISTTEIEGQSQQQQDHLHHPPTRDGKEISSTATPFLNRAQRRNLGSEEESLSGSISRLSDAYNNHQKGVNHHPDDYDNKKTQSTNMWKAACHYMSSTRLLVLVVLCLQNSLFTVLRRYSQGVLQEVYSKVSAKYLIWKSPSKYPFLEVCPLLKVLLSFFPTLLSLQHELLLVAEIIKIAYSAWMISKGLPEGKSVSAQLFYLIETSRKMLVLAFIYGAMNILSFVSLRNISAGMFTIFAQLKIISTATFSTIILKQQYSWTKWRALIALMLGVLLFSEPIWGDPNKQKVASKDANQALGTAAVLIEVTLSGFASIYFEKVIKTDTLQLGIWERNFQLALGSFPVYIMFIVSEGGGQAGFFGGWSLLALLLSALGAAGGLLVALSIKYGDSILKTLATTGAIVLTGVLDHILLSGPLTPSMIIAGLQVIIAICNYSFDPTPSPAAAAAATASTLLKVDSKSTTKSAPRSKVSNIPSNIIRTAREGVVTTAPKSAEMEDLLRRPSYDVELGSRHNDD